LTRAARPKGRNVGVVVVGMLLSIVAAMSANAVASRRQATRLTFNPATLVSPGVVVTAGGRLASARSRVAIGHQPLGLYWEPTGTRGFWLLATTHTHRNGSFSFTYKLSAGKGQLVVKFAGSARWSGSSSFHQIEVGTPGPAVAPPPVKSPSTGSAPHKQAAPVPSKPVVPVSVPPVTAPAPTPAPKSSGVPPLPPIPAGALPDAESAGIQVQQAICTVGEITRGFPSIVLPVSEWVFTFDALLAEPSNGSAGWHVEALSPTYWYNNAGKAPIFDWFNAETNAVGGANLGVMDRWFINSGWNATIVQFVYDGGWYMTFGNAACAF